MALRGLFYSEFDNIAGPQIVFQAPPKYGFVFPVIWRFQWCRLWCLIRSGCGAVC